MAESNVLSIKSLNEENQKLAQQIIAHKNEYNALLERFLVEKQQCAEKMNEINTLYEQLQMKQKILDYDKQDFQ